MNVNAGLSSDALSSSMIPIPLPIPVAAEHAIPRYTASSSSNAGRLSFELLQATIPPSDTLILDRPLPSSSLSTSCSCSCSCSYASTISTVPSICSSPNSIIAEDEDEDEEDLAAEASLLTRRTVLDIPRGGGENNNSQSSSSDDNDDNHNDPLLEEILKHEDDYYRVLGLASGGGSGGGGGGGGGHSNPHFSSAQITKAYRRRAVQTHPDKTGGDRRAFDLVAQAYDVLSNDETRAIYNRYGKAGLEQQKGQHFPSSSSSFHDFVSQMFHTSSSSSSSQQHPFRQNRTVRYQLQVTLEELYRGVTKEVSLGTTSSSRFHAPNNKNRRHHATKTVQVDIPRGAMSGQPIRLPGVMDEIDDAPPGDLILVLTQAPHSIFTRKHHDVAMELTLSLEEAICGFQRTIPLLDGTTIDIASATATGTATATKPTSHEDDNEDNEDNAPPLPPLVIATGDVQVLKGRGFPKMMTTTTTSSRHSDDDDDHDDHRHHDDVEYGDLYIQFRVEMPQSSSNKGSSHPLSLEEREQLRTLLEKLQGKKQQRRTKKVSTSTSHATTTTTATTTSTTKRKKSTTKKKVKDSSSSSEASASRRHPRRLVPGRVADFGRKTGTARWQSTSDDHHDPNHFEDEEEGAAYSSFFGGSPFGTGSSTFFSNGRTHTFSFGGSRNHPFFAGDDHDDGAGHPGSQCQQM